MRNTWYGCIDTQNFPEAVQIDTGDNYGEYALPIFGETYDDYVAFTGAGFDPYVAHELSEVTSRSYRLERLVGYFNHFMPYNSLINDPVQWFNFRLGFCVGAYNANATNRSVWNPWDQDDSWMYLRDWPLHANTQLTFDTLASHLVASFEIDIRVNRILADDEVVWMHVGVQNWFGNTYDQALTFYYHARLRALAREIGS